ATAIFGKWHLGYSAQFNPTLRGFDQFCGFVSGNIDAQSHYDRMVSEDWWNNDRLQPEYGHHTDLINQHALRFIEENRNRPFFLYVPHGTPHSPHQARGSAIQRGPKKGQVPAWAPKETYSQRPGDDDWLIKHFVLPVDEGVGKIREKIEALGLANDTVIWFISDNGGTKGNFSTSPRTRAAKSSPFEGGHRVPGIVWAPGRIPAGTESDALILSMDILPTSLAMIAPQPGAEATEPPRTLDGIDVSPAIRMGKSLPKRTVMWGMKNKGALRRGNWKWVLPGGKQSPMLFDIQNDPREQKDLAQQHADIAAQLQKTYESMLADARADSPYRDP
ncbi:MAG: sulfatase-like hydrolase/transferase, partial [Planctomycetota bacterium]